MDLNEINELRINLTKVRFNYLLIISISLIAIIISTVALKISTVDKSTALLFDLLYTVVVLFCIWRRAVVRKRLREIPNVNTHSDGK